MRPVTADLLTGLGRSLGFMSRVPTSTLSCPLKFVFQGPMVSIGT